MTRRLGVLVSLALAIAAMLVALPSGPSSALATMTVATRDDATRPQLLSSTVGRLTDVDVSSDANATNVHVVFSGVGLVIDTPDVGLGNVDGSERATVEVTATTPGFHTLNIQVTSNNSPTVNTSLPLMWAPGTAAPGTGDLSGRNYGNTDLYEFAGTSYEDRRLLSFLDEDTAYIGNPAKGRPTCPTASETKTAGCVAYHYDTGTGLVQIGGTIGKVVGKAVYVEGIGRGNDQGGETFNQRTFRERVGYPALGKRYGVTWRWRYENYPDGLSFVRLLLRKNGTFVLTTAELGEDDRVKKGTYRLTAPGRLRLKGAFGVELHTLAVRAKANGKAAPAKGAWLTFGQGKNADVVRLTPAT